MKTCEPVKDMRLCRAPRDWSLLALQNVRTGKSHYLVICHCPETSILGNFSGLVLSLGEKNRIVILISLISW